MRGYLSKHTDTCRERQARATTKQTCGPSWVSISARGERSSLRQIQVSMPTENHPLSLGRKATPPRGECGAALKPDNQQGQNTYHDLPRIIGGLLCNLGSFQFGQFFAQPGSHMIWAENGHGQPAMWGRFEQLVCVCVTPASKKGVCFWQTRTSRVWRPSPWFANTRRARCKRKHTHTYPG